MVIGQLFLLLINAVTAISCSQTGLNMPLTNETNGHGPTTVRSQSSEGTRQSMRSVKTGLPSTPVIEEFIDGYLLEHWEACAARAQALIQEQLREAKDKNDEPIQAKVTCRAKTKMSLEEKLKMRNHEREKRGEEAYKDGNDIRQDIKDLAGVRVVLYTPNSAQRDKLRQIVKAIWKDVEEKPHGNPVSTVVTEEQKRKQNVYIRRHLGYQADHYRAFMLPTQSVQDQGGYKFARGDMIEIQVVSALGHAWAEAGHDVLYKTHAYGRPNLMELRILDALSGLIVSGDVLLEQFRESVTKRTVTKWEYFDQFKMFLRESDILERDDDDNETIGHWWEDFSDDGIHILYRFLEKTQNNYPLAVRNTLINIGYPKDPSLQLKLELSKYNPRCHIPDGLLTPFCVISQLLPERERKETVGISAKCSIMLDALILLQTFAGGPKPTKGFLSKLAGGMTDSQEASINWVLSDIQRIGCFDPNPNPKRGKELQPAWEWFEQEVANKASLCGLFFRLAEMDVPAKEMSPESRLSALRIGSLSRANTLDDITG